ncbi:Putative glycerol channel activator [Komagataella phaffii CBS 7435]|uniref:Pleckstrin homology domain containing protein proposed to function as a glycerol channel activator n=2 Tax=Komagataella phaffii TaxID=460519 RepID=C4R0T5_KOMPG|nr:Pleckstrin homology domain containing protein proposed to function as a glycerol channel activator [Komagataella phaffii GS115]AOA63128.1 GQ67_00525T0 [Komagataella phaffii]CAH2448371.1 Putative glycerol channel activator [Komagataella phaffii CBS 7435]AOA67059.1 GQ68_00863T0 [Komagataella phaffii GS115]CAY69109.1 Pleckstrin homology domain containing protein proposed to function as a glycerol channel activator [Komagataella phaffii GS115]CCA38498.1 Putative glycerol channel activator [Koma
MSRAPSPTGSYFSHSSKPSGSSFAGSRPALHGKESNESVFSSNDSLTTDPLRNGSQNLSLPPPSDPSSPYHIALPLNPHPVEQLVNRFTIWKKLIKELIFYFKELSSLKQHYYELNIHMLNNIKLLTKPSAKSVAPLDHNDDPTGELAAFTGTTEEKFMKTAFLPPSGSSITSVRNTLHNYHRALAEKELVTYNQLTLKVIPRLENFKRSLNSKIKEILTLKNDFKLQKIKSQVAMTGQLLSDYVNVIELFNRGSTTTPSGLDTSEKYNSKLTSSGKYDPYVLKLRFDLQLRQQLLEENMVRESFLSIQKAGLLLEEVVYKEVQNAFGKFANLIDAEVNTVKKNLVEDLKEGFLKNVPSSDWDYFILNDKANFLNISSKEILNPSPGRKLSNIVYPYQKKLAARCIRSGHLEKKNKLLKSYAKGYYVLTLNFLHEFKTPDRKKEYMPQSSLPLDRVVLKESDRESRKFVLHDTSTKTNHIFKCVDAVDAGKWYTDLKELTKYASSIERNTVMEFRYANSVAKQPVQGHSKNSSESSIYLPERTTSPLPAELKDTEELRKNSSSFALPTFKNLSTSKLDEVLSAPLHESPNSDSSSTPSTIHQPVPSISITRHQSKKKPSKVPVRSDTPPINTQQLRNNGSVKTGDIHSSFALSGNHIADQREVSSSSQSNLAETNLTTPDVKGYEYNLDTPGKTPDLDYFSFKGQNAKSMANSSSGLNTPTESISDSANSSTSKFHGTLELPTANFSDVIRNNASIPATPGELPSSSIKDMIKQYGLDEHLQE